jgi:hypothetical protein
VPCKPTYAKRGSLPAPEVISMKAQIIEFARSLSPEADVVTALELLMIYVSAVLDDILFSEEDESDPLMLDSPDENYYWDYVY